MEALPGKQRAMISASIPSAQQTIWNPRDASTWLSAPERSRSFSTKSASMESMVSRMAGRCQGEIAQDFGKQIEIFLPDSPD
jgi:hypothetical protein